MTPQEYARHCKEMSSTHGTSGLFTRRRNLEMIYFMHHKKRGVRLRGKYRPR